jgi:DnaJ family protein A protein 1
MVKNGDIESVLNEGMPIYCRPYEKACPIAEFKVTSLKMAFSPLINFLCWKIFGEEEVEETNEMDQV